MFVPAAAVTSRASARPDTTVPDVFVPVQVTITDNRISLNRTFANRGDEVRFTIRNVGTKVHSFSLGGARAGTGKQVGFSATVKPRQQKYFLLFMDYRGKLPYHSIIKADLKKPGMHGYFSVH